MVGNESRSLERGARMEAGPYRILLVDDDEDDYYLTHRMLQDASGSRYVVTWAPDPDTALQKMSSEPLDAVLVDYDLGAVNGIELARQMMQKDYRGPIILLTGRGSYAVDLEAMQSGVMDYLNKNEVTAQLLERTLRYAIERKQIEEALRLAKEEMEQRVLERTLELVHKNETLLAEIAERKRVEAELEEMSRRMMESVESERILLAQELHDGPMQELYGLSFRLNLLERMQEEAERAREIRQLQADLARINGVLRSIAGELRPPALAPFGLEKALRGHADRFQQDHPELKLELMLMPDGQNLDEQVRLALFRIYQVAMNNVLRHAQARQVKVRFEYDAEEAVLEVEDDGRGFEIPKRWISMVRDGHFGLAGAFERANALGGAMEVRSQPGNGTCIRVTVPLAGAE